MLPEPEREPYVHKYTARDKLSTEMGNVVLLQMAKQSPPLAEARIRGRIGGINIDVEETGQAAGHLEAAIEGYSPGYLMEVSSLVDAADHADEKARDAHFEQHPVAPKTGMDDLIAPEPNEAPIDQRDIGTIASPHVGLLSNEKEARSIPRYT